MSLPTLKKIHEKLLYYLKPLRNPPKYTKEEKIRLASYIDCDGCIFGRHRSVIALRVSDAIYVVNLKERFKKIAKMGDIHLQKKKPNNVYEWNISRFKEILHFLSNIKPYLILKQRQAELSIEFIQSRIDRGVETIARLPYSDREREIVDEIQKLNRYKGYKSPKRRKRL